MKEEQLIFIISQPRSGSTYLQSLISNHARVNTVSEPWLLLNFASILKPKLITSVFDSKLTSQALDELKSKIETNYFDATFKKFVLEIYKPLINNYDFFIDKTPRYWEIVDELINLFPKSKFIILKRNPLDVSKSIVKTWGVSSLIELSYYHRDLLFAPLIISKFVEHNKNASVYELSYDDLIKNKISTLKTLFDWIGISYSDEILDTSKNLKFKGSLGDPKQNKEQQITKYDSKGFENSEIFKNFLIGYNQYLNRNKIINTDLYNNDTTISYNNDFIYFLKLSGLDKKLDAVSYEELVVENEIFKKENIALKSSKSFKLGQMLIKPFVFILRFFK